MVRGLDIFREFFAGSADQYVLIGGTAATLAMDSAGLEFRATKDLDIVLHIEALNPTFGRIFWTFVGRGQYEIRQASQTGKPVLYRFQKPADTRYPAMLELFCRSPDGIELAEDANLTPIPIGDALASLSAILLDNDYYRFIISGRKTVNQLPRIDADRLIPLKARAWLDLSERKTNGEPIDTRDIRKHANDVLRLSQLLTSESHIESSSGIRNDLARFLAAVRADGSYDPKSLQIGATTSEIVDRIAKAYGLVEPA